MKNSLTSVLSVFFCAFLLLAHTTFALANEGYQTLVAAEAYVDDHQLTTDLDLNNVIAHGFAAISGLIDMASLSEGTHTVYLRVQDETREWSKPVGQSFYIANSGQVAGHGQYNYLQQAEFFFDTDPGEGKGNIITIAEDGLFNQSYEKFIGREQLKNLSSGLHTVYVRAQDANGIWSPAIGQSVSINNSGFIGEDTGVNYKLKAAEAFFDIDPGLGKGFAIQDVDTVSASVNGDALHGLIDIAQLSSGIHTLYIRYQNQAGLWSSALGQSVYITAELVDNSINVGAVSILSAEYALDGGIFKVAPLADGEPGGLVEEIDFTIPVTSAGYHSVEVRFTDSKGHTSQGNNTTSATPNDLDWDGLPDAWEKQYLGGTGYTIHDDPDEDGLSNGEEFLRGTDPLVKDNTGIQTISGFVHDSDGKGVANISICIDIDVSTTDCSEVTDASGHYLLNEQGALALGTYSVYPKTTDSQNYAFTPLRTSVGLDLVSVSQVNFTVEALSIDNIPPEITKISNAEEIRSGKILVQATDSSGTIRVEFTLDGAALVSHTEVDGYSAIIDYISMEQGAHELAFTVYDGYQNSVSKTINLNLQFQTPVQPVITFPANGSIVGTAALTLRGTANIQAIALINVDDDIATNAVFVGIGTESTVQLYLNSSALGTPLPVNSNGYFQQNISLPTGGGTYTAKTITRAGESPLSDAVSISLDQQGPEISSISYLGNPLVNNILLTQSDIFTVNIADASRVEFRIDGVLVLTDTNGTNGYSLPLTITSLTEGAHTLTISAYDSFDNVTTQTITFIVAVAPPVAPILTSPSTGLVTNQTQIIVKGKAEALSTVTLSVNGTASSNTVAVTENGLFEGTVTLTEGVNSITAITTNRGGNSPASAAISVTQDNSIPQAPVLSITVNDGEEIVLNWNAIEAEPSVSGYKIYRANTAFSTINEAQQLNTGLLNATTYTDLPDSDGNYYYRVVAENGLGTKSPLSNQVAGNIDSTAPHALSIQYIPSGYYDEVGGRFGVGEVEVIVTVNEPLLTTPFFSLTPNLGVPITVTLAKTSDTEYRGKFEIKQSSPTGIAYGVFSARDLVGNRGTTIDEGASIIMDTDGPIITALTLTPHHPIKNDVNNPTTVNVIVELDEPIQTGLQPTLSYKLSGVGREDILIDNFTLSEPLKWTASFVLPADAAEVDPETLQFSFEAQDDLDNISTKITANNAFQVYQGDLPPLDFPLNLKATSLADGQIKLTWDSVDEATDYLIYRQAPNENALQILVRSNNALEYIDQTDADGTYLYAVATVRAINNEESISSPGQTVEVIADATAPATPQNLQLELAGVGIKATWENSSPEEEVSYLLYRSSDTEIPSVEGLNPIVDKITDLTTIDPSPSQAEHAYVVTAIDASGNESEPSETAYLNFALLPINTFSVVQDDNQQPVLTWSHTSPTTIAGYNLHISNTGDANGIDHNQLTETDFTDTGYANNERLYTVIAYDSNDVKSINRQLLLPNLKAELEQDTQLKRGVMNRLSYTVSNEGSSSVSHIKIQVITEAHQAQSEQFTLNAGEAKVIEVVLGGYQDLDGLTTLKSIIKVQPDQNSQVKIIRYQDVLVTDSGLAFNIATRDFTRGATGEAQISLINNSDVEVEIKTGRNNNSPSDDIRFKLIDPDGNILSIQGFKQSLGDKIVTLANGQTVARIAAGETFVSNWIPLAVPSSAPDSIDVVLEVDKLHYHLGKADAESINVDLQSSQSIALIETAYYAEISNVTPEISYGDEDIIITGQAINRSSQQAERMVPLKLVIATNRFERVKEIQTDTEGNFSYTFKPLTNESGNYKVSVIHPDILERPQQAQFSIGNMVVGPTTINLNVPRNLSKTGNITLYVNAGTLANNVRLELKAEDQESGVLPTGIDITLADPVNVSSKQSINLPLTIKGDDNALESGRFVLILRSDETGNRALSKVTVNYNFSDATPFLGFSPAHLQTGVVYDGSVTELIQLENKGLQSLDNINLSLLTQQGTPAPLWVKLQTVSALGDLAVAEKYPVQIQVSPNNTISEGMHNFVLRVSSDNFDTTDIPITVAVTQSGIGNALIKIADIYTATLDDEGEPIQGVTNARIKLINENVNTIEKNLKTDNTGEALFTDLVAGTYRYRVSADNHKDKTGQLQIKPGITVAESVFLNYELVTVEWSVNEIALQDVYEITLQATYVTDVPAAVIVVNPSSTALPSGLKKGDVYNGEFTVTNYGLIRADNLNVKLPTSDQFIKYELMGGIPDTLGAKESITVPYRAVMLQSFEPDGTASGAGCYNYTECGEASATSDCANGDTSDTKSPYCVTYSSSDCSTSSGGTGGGVWGGGGGGSWGWGGGGWGGGTTTNTDNSGMSNCRSDNPGYCSPSGNGGG